MGYAQIHSEVSDVPQAVEVIDSQEDVQTSEALPTAGIHNHLL